MVNVLDCDIVVSEFELQLRYCVSFRTDTLRKGSNPFISTFIYGLNSTTTVILLGMVCWSEH